MQQYYICVYDETLSSLEMTKSSKHGTILGDK